MPYTTSSKSSTRVSGLSRLRTFLLSKACLVLGATTLVQASTSLVGTCIAVLGPFLREEFGLSRVELGALVSARHFGAAAGGVPVSWLADRFGARLTILVAPLITGSAIVGFAAIPGWRYLAFALLM